MGKRKAKNDGPKKKRPTLEAIIDRSPATIAAVLYCLQHSTPSYGAVAVMKVTRPNGDLMFPAVTKNEVHNHLKALRALRVPASTWTLDKVGAAMFPQRPFAGQFLLSDRDEDKLAQWIVVEGKSGDPMSRNKIRKHIRIMLLDRLKQNKDPRYRTQPMTQAAKRIIDFPAGNQYPANTWFRKFFARKANMIQERKMVTKDVQRGRAMDAQFLHDDMIQLHDGLFDLNILTDDGKWEAIPEDDNFYDRGYHARARVFQMDEKGQFFYYDTIKGRMGRIKFAVATGSDPMRIDCENRSSFSYVPWCDCNGRFIFAQLIYKGVAPLECHLTENLRHSSVLVQYTHDGNQNCTTFAEALTYLDEKLKQIHNNNPHICGPNVQRVVTTDGHYSRKGDESLNTALQLNIHIQIRKGGASFITQMWDQVFHKFADEYQKYVGGIRANFECERTNQYEQFKMTKQVVTCIISNMHINGLCTWCTPGDILQAFEKVGITRAGLNVALLLENPLVTNSTNKATTSTLFAKTSLPIPLPAPRPTLYETPPGTRKDISEYSAAKIKHLEARLLSFEQLPEDITEALLRLKQPSEYEKSFAEPLTTMLSKEGPRTQHQVADTNRDVNTASGVITKMAWLLDKKKEQKENREGKAAAKKTQDDVYLSLRDRFFKCKASATCTCGEERCLRLIYHYCEECDKRGTDKCVQKTVCQKQVCKSARAQSSSESPPSDTTAEPSSSDQPPTNLIPLQPTSSPTDTLNTTSTTMSPPHSPPHTPIPPTPAPTNPPPSDIPPSTTLPLRLSVPDPNCISNWDANWDEGVFAKDDKLMVKDVVDGKSLWRLGIILVNHPNAVKIEYHEVSGGTPKEICPKEYLSKERYGPHGWWVFLERAIVDRSQKRRRIQKVIQHA
eukprot:m.259163 g.259163  ORF g.259163 m.259163 type:complete len:897 (+) comp37639_c0_seq1:202-2892(+)